MNFKALTLCAALAACGGGGSADTAPVSRPLVLVEFAGQSNAGQGGVDAIIETQAREANVWQFAGASKVGYGFQERPVSAEVEPAKDVGGSGQWVATMAGQPMGAADKTRDYILRTDWYGGASLSSFVRGTANFSNTMRAVRAAKAVGASRGQPVLCDWYVWIQGESGPTGRENYASRLAEYIASIRGDIASELGAAAPTFVIVQTNVGDWISPDVDVSADDSVALAQLDAANTAPGAIMAGPMYQAPIIVDWEDNIHASSIGRMVLGDMLAAVRDAGPGWKPLQPIGATRNGRVIEVKFHVPAGALAFDSQWIKPLANYGFTHTAGIESVAIVGPDTVRVTLQTESPGVLRYAMGAGDSTLDGWASGRGQLISPTARPSYWHRMGHPVPALVNHYAVRFELQVN